MLCTATRHVADLIEEKRAAVALLEPADALGDGAGEGAFLMAEEFAFEELLGDGGAVDGDEILPAALAVMVDGAGDEFLAGAALAGDHHRGVADGRRGPIILKTCCIAADLPTMLS